MKIFEKDNKLNFAPANSDEPVMQLFKEDDTVYMPPIAPVPEGEEGE